MFKNKLLERKTIPFADNVEFIEVEPVKANPMISRVKIRIAKPGQGNQYYISKETLEKAAKKSLGLTPILAYFNFYKKDFGEHSEQAVYNEFGEFITIGDTQAVGIIPENPEVFWDEEDFLVTFGYLWTSLYKESSLALEGRPQSMELSAEHSYFKPLGNGLIEIVETAFQALCILGNDVKPAFTGAGITAALEFSKSDKLIDKIDKGVDMFMKDLKFALNNNFNEEEVDLIVDVDGEERDIKNRQKITDAIDTLDDVAEEAEDEENIGIIDDAITMLVDAEMDMKREAAVIPASKIAQEALQGTVDRNENILTSEDLTYKLKKKNSIVQPGGEKEEEDLPKNKKKIEEEVVEEKTLVQEKEEAPVQEPEVPEEKAEDAIPNDNVDEPTEERVGDTEANAEKSDTAEGDREENQGMDRGGIPIKAGAEEETNAEIANGRQTAASKRTSNLLSELSDAEVFEALVDRIQATEEMKTKLSQALGVEVQNTLPLGGEIQPNEAAAANIEDTGNFEETGVELPKEENSDEPETVAEEVEVEPAVEEEKEEVVEPVADKEEEETVEEEVLVEEEEEKKKKKVNFSNSEIANLIKENERLKEENKSLLQFKLDVDSVAKENTLLQFSLSEEAKEAIRAQFSELSIVEVENQAIIAEYKENKNKTGQKETEEAIVFSSVEEEADMSTLGGEMSTLKQFLASVSTKNID